MLFNAVSTIHTHLTKDQRHSAFARRAEYSFPVGMKVVHEVWRTTAPEIVSTFECDTFEPILAMQLAWADFMQMSVSPCTTPEDGLKTGAKILGAMHSKS